MSTIIKKPFYSTLWLLWILCLLPVILAGFLYYTPAIRWVTYKTNGTLLQTPVSVTGLTLPPVVQADRSSKTWELWYVVAESCDKRCQSDLKQLQNARQALGKERHRVILRTIEPQKALPFLKPGALAIVDPLDWLMLYYEPNAPYKGMLTDLRRLLKYSRIG